MEEKTNEKTDSKVDKNYRYYIIILRVLLYLALKDNIFNGLELATFFTFPVSIFFICASEERLNTILGRKK